MEPRDASAMEYRGPPSSSLPMDIHPHDRMVLDQGGGGGYGQLRSPAELSQPAFASMSYPGDNAPFQWQVVPSPPQVRPLPQRSYSTTSAGVLQYVPPSTTMSLHSRRTGQQTQELFHQQPGSSVPDSMSGSHVLHWGGGGPPSLESAPSTPSLGSNVPLSPLSQDGQSYSVAETSPGSASSPSDSPGSLKTVAPLSTIHEPPGELEESSYGPARASRPRRSHSVNTPTSPRARALTMDERSTRTQPRAVDGQELPRSSNANAGAFVYKLYQMVTDQRYQELIGFSDSGRTFIVKDVQSLARDVLPQYYKHSNFSSFVRQLNMYSFSKTNKSIRGQGRRTEDEIWEFSHPLFVRGKPDQLGDIKRKPSESERDRDRDRDRSDRDPLRSSRSSSSNPTHGQQRSLSRSLNTSVGSASAPRARDASQPGLRLMAPATGLLSMSRSASSQDPPSSASSQYSLALSRSRVSSFESLQSATVGTSTPTTPYSSGMYSPNVVYDAPMVDGTRAPALPSGHPGHAPHGENMEIRGGKVYLQPTWTPPAGLLAPPMIPTPASPNLASPGFTQAPLAAQQQAPAPAPVAPWSNITFYVSKGPPKLEDVKQANEALYRDLVESRRRESDLAMYLHSVYEYLRGVTGLPNPVPIPPQIAQILAQHAGRQMASPVASDGPPQFSPGVGQALQLDTVPSFGFGLGMQNLNAAGDSDSPAASVSSGSLASPAIASAGSSRQPPSGATSHDVAMNAAHHFKVPQPPQPSTSVPQSLSRTATPALDYFGRSSASDGEGGTAGLTSRRGEAQRIVSAMNTPLPASPITPLPPGVSGGEQGVHGQAFRGYGARFDGIDETISLGEAGRSQQYHQSDPAQRGTQEGNASPEQQYQAMTTPPSHAVAGSTDDTVFGSFYYPPSTAGGQQRQHQDEQPHHQEQWPGFSPQFSSA